MSVFDLNYAMGAPCAAVFAETRLVDPAGRPGWDVAGGFHEAGDARTGRRELHVMVMMMMLLLRQQAAAAAAAALYTTYMYYYTDIVETPDRT